MSQRIFLVCAEVFQDVQIETESGLDAQMEYLTQNDTLIDLVLEKADLDIIDQVVAKEYCREKVRNDYLYDECFLYIFRSLHIFVACSNRHH